MRRRKLVPVLKQLMGFGKDDALILHKAPSVHPMQRRFAHSWPGTASTCPP